MTNDECHYIVEDGTSTLLNKAPRPTTFSRVSRFRRWLLPALTVTLLGILIIALGVSNLSTLNRLWAAEKSVLNLTESLKDEQQVTKDAAKEVLSLKFAMEDKQNQLTDAAKEVLSLKFAMEDKQNQLTEALKQLKRLSILDAIRRMVAELKCFPEHLINNANWDSVFSNCYLFSTIALSWHDARDWCNGHESHLVIILTDEEWNFVTQRTMGTRYWVGLTDERNDQWEWVDQTPYIMNRRWWRPGQPDSWTRHGLGPGDEDCGHLTEDGVLNDLHCSSKLRFVCQIRSTQS